MTQPDSIPAEWIEAALKAMFCAPWHTPAETKLARDAITILRPLIEAETRERCAQIAEHPLGLRTTIMPHPLLGAGAERCVTWIVEHIRDEASSALRAEGK